jgi:LemA protein
MTRRHVVQFVILALAALPLGGCSYNKFVAMDQAVQTQWAQVQNQLQRRNDLIPNLVESVKGYAAHEEGVFREVAESRSRLLAAKTPEETIQAANQQTSALGRLLAISENYPQLKANEQFNRLMDELAGTENRIAVERQRYNERIQEYNTATKQFPANVTAKMFGFKEHPFFQAPPEATQVRLKPDTTSDRYLRGTSINVVCAFAATSLSLKDSRKYSPAAHSLARSAKYGLSGNSD